MPGPFDRSHLRIDGRIRRADFTAVTTGRGSNDGFKNRGDHAARLVGDLKRSYAAFEASRQRDARLPAPEGVFLEVDLQRGSSIDSLNMKRPGIEVGPASLRTNDERRVGLYVPDNARDTLSEKLARYGSDEVTAKGRIPLREKFEPIKAIEPATLETFWTDDLEDLPTSGQNFWWEVWVRKDRTDAFLALAQNADLHVSDPEQWLNFADHTVLQILGTREALELVVFNGPSVVELRKAGDNPRVYLEEFDADDQSEAIEDLFGRTGWPGRNAPAVCLLDTGVARAHPLIEPALDEDDLMTVNVDWGIGDNLNHPHGTPMAGLALYGDLTFLMSSTSTVSLSHRLESVKLLPPDGAAPTPETAYGAVTQQAVALAELNKPDRRRVFSLTITSDRSGYRPTSWSSAVDQSASGRDISGDTSPPRLFVIAAGNATYPIDFSQVQHPDALQIEDPAQAWNAVTVGGYTDKINIDEPDLPGYTPFAETGDISPYTRTSFLWTQGRAPFKPDIVMEAGNRAISPTQKEIYCVDSLALLSTSTGNGNHQLEASRATSAATAQAARMCARLMAEHPDLWPETIRGLVVHSARWTIFMGQVLANTNGKMARYPLLRRFGHGVPEYQRAAKSASDSLALIAEQSIQPFTEDGRGNECHYYDLPWPRRALEGLGNAEVRLKVTLSWFVEPNPGSSASFDPARYQSFGLRFDLRRPGESIRNFEMRNNKKAQEQYEDSVRSVKDDDNWKFGPKAQGAGSLISDEWIGPAVNLLQRDQLCIRPVGGWWKTSSEKAIRASKGRYSLVVTLETPDVSQDIYTPIEVELEQQIDIEV